MIPATRQLIASLDIQWREFFEERAAILEYECKLSRDEAEQAAWMETSSAMLKSRIRKLAEDHAQKPHEVKIPHIQPGLDHKMLAAGEHDD